MPERGDLADPQCWQRGATYARRLYQSYRGYLEHQASKLANQDFHDRLAARKHVRRQRFRDSFRGCAELAGRHVVLCLGARLGSEVAALRDLGHFAVGIDLNPGAANQFVLHGDFHVLTFPPQSVDAVFTNALDHAWEIDTVIHEVARVLRPDGVFIADLLPGYDEGLAPSAYEAFAWRDRASLIDTICAAGDFTQLSARRLDDLRWQQVVFRKREAAHG